MRFVLLLFISLICSPVLADYTYEGPWKTENRKLDGIQTCVVKRLGKKEWQGRFYGTWQGVDFDYTVKFSGPPDDLQGTATIDGAGYNWKGSITNSKFKATFDGSRYNGYFDMPRKKHGCF